MGKAAIQIAMRDAGSVLNFGAFEADLATGELRRHGRTVKLQPQPFKVLALLLERQGELVTREEIRQRLWGQDTFVDFEHGLNFAINKIREALDDHAARPRYVETLPRRGYRFIAPVERAGTQVTRPLSAKQPATIPQSPTTAIPQQLRHAPKVVLLEVGRSAAPAVAAPPNLEPSRTGYGAAPAVGGGAASRGAPWSKHWRLVALAIVTALIAAAVAAWLFPGRRGGQSSGTLRIAPFSGLSGLEGQPAFSSDGRELAYVCDDGSRAISQPVTAHPLGHICVKLIGAGAPLQLTHGPLLDQDPAWSPDGRHIAFIRSWSSTNRMSQVISIPALGGPERHLGEIDGPLPARGVTWSPDGNSVVTNIGSDPGLFLLSTENGQKTRLTSPQKDARDTDPAFSPDGRNLAFIRRTELYLGDIYLQGPHTAEARRLTFDNGMIWGLAWTPDGRDIVFSSKRSGFATLWKIPASGGEIEPVPGVGGNAFLPAISPRGNLLAYAVQELNVNIWRMQVGPSGRVQRSPSKIISGSGLQVDDEISPDGKRVVFASDRSGDMEIWVANIDGSNPLQLTSLRSALAGSPRWSPDGRWIAFDSHRAGHEVALVVDADGGVPRQLNPPGMEAFVPSWSRDGKSVYFSSDAGGNWRIWKVPAHGGDAVRVGDGFEPRESDDEKWLYSMEFLGEGKIAILRAPVGGGAESVVFTGVTQRLWSLDARYLYFVSVDSSAHATLNRFNLATQKSTRIVDVEKEPFVLLSYAGLSVSPDGGSIIYPQLDQRISRIMLVENFRW